MTPLLDEKGRINTRESIKPGFLMETLMEISDTDLAYELAHCRRLAIHYDQLARVVELTQDYIAKFGREAPDFAQRASGTDASQDLNSRPVGG